MTSSVKILAPGKGADAAVERSDKESELAEIAKGEETGSGHSFLRLTPTKFILVERG